MKKALITGIAGPDGFSLAQLLLEKGYVVHGIKRHTPLFTHSRSATAQQTACADHNNFNLHYADLTDAATLTRLVQEIQPDEIYNLGTMSYVNAPFETPEYALEVNGLGTLRLLEAVRISGLAQKTRIYQTCNSASDKPLRHGSTSTSAHLAITTPAKLCSQDIMMKYRVAYGMYACNGIVFNQEVPRCGETLLAHKISQGAVRTALGLQGILYLDTLDTHCDWGHAREYAEAIWRVLQQNKPADFELTTGVITTVREFVRLAFAELDIDIVFQGEGAQEAGFVAACHNADFSLMPGQTVVAIDPIYYRPVSVEPSLAEASKARRQLGWKPQHDLTALVQELVQHALEQFRRDTHLIETGHQVLLHST